ncbi:VWA domain-containing protein [Hymenobacter telluris]|uniref:VWA domain-containing protein n=1 Tax=Hymenobacter telluris TaxID=2816474 RepID=UPI001F5E0D2F|nr:VWA domain-containing protein [Hymenobacter telluris]
MNHWRQRWHLSPLERYAVQLVSEAGFPVVGATVRLLDRRDSVLWQAQSDNTGKCELWNGLFTDRQPSNVASLQAVVEGKTYSLRRPTVFAQGVNVLRVRQPCQAPSIVDIAFVVDATSSMGDEIQYLQAELGDVITQAKDSLASSTLRLASVFYRDAGDEYVTRKTNFSADLPATLDFIRHQQAGGGGDFPEAVDQALTVALNELSWSPHAKARLLFLLLDAPPHENPPVLASLQRSIRQAAAQGIRIIPVTASGIDKSTEYLMRSMALATNGTYVFLTDDSGVGEAHLKPTTDQFTVERLNTLLVKLMAKYAYTVDCQAPPATRPHQAETLSGHYQQVADTTMGTTHSTKREKRYTWTCYPNPVSEVLHVQLEADIPELFITDVTGKILLRAVPAHYKATIELGSFPTGVYFLRFFAGTRWEQARFLVSR